MPEPVTPCADCESTDARTKAVKDPLGTEMVVLCEDCYYARKEQARQGE